jgi:hypothetical protein
MNGRLLNQSDLTLNSIPKKISMSEENKIFSLGGQAFPLPVCIWGRLSGTEIS